MTNVSIVHDTDWQPKYLAYLAPVLMMTMLVNQFLNLKSIDVFGYGMIASNLTYPLSLIIGDILTEVYGFKRTRRLMYICLVLYALSAALVQLAVILPPAADYKNNEMFVGLFGWLPQIVVAGIAGYLSGELINSFVLSRLKIATKGKHFYFRALASTLISQIINCVIFFGIGFWGIMSFETIVTSAAVSIMIVLLYEILVLPITKKVALTLKEKEGIDHFDA